MDVSRLPVAAVGRWLRSVRPERAHLRADLVAGLPGAISSVPDGMAAAVLAGVNPVQGLYSGFAGPIVGGLSSNTRHPARHPAAACPRHQALFVQPGHRRAGDGRHHPRPGRRGGRSRTQPRQCPAESESGHHRARRWQPGRGFLPWHRGGGSVGSTALNVTVGGKTRWATIWAGVWMLIILALFSGLVAKIAVPTLGAILIFAAIGSLRPGEVATILHRAHLPGPGHYHLCRDLVPAGRRSRRHRGGPVAPAAAQPGRHGPRRRRADATC